MLCVGLLKETSICLQVDSALRDQEKGIWNTDLYPKDSIFIWVPRSCP